jgi:hypothetical protein
MWHAEPQGQEPQQTGEEDGSIEGKMLLQRALKIATRRESFKERYDICSEDPEKRVKPLTVAHLGTKPQKE